MTTPDVPFLVSETTIIIRSPHLPRWKAFSEQVRSPAFNHHIHSTEYSFKTLLCAVHFSFVTYSVLLFVTTAQLRNAVLVLP